MKVVDKLVYLGSVEGKDVKIQNEINEEIVKSFECSRLT